MGNHNENLKFQSPFKRLNRLYSCSYHNSQQPSITMKHLAAFLLLGLGGNSSPSAADIKAVLESVGIDADNERLEKLLSELKDKDINELISEGSSKLASVPSGGAGAAAGGAAGGAAEETKAEEKEEEKEESDDDMGFG